MSSPPHPVRSLGVKQNFLGLDDENSSFEDSQIAVLQAPYEHTTTYGQGASAGPAAVVAASHYVEFYDDEFARELAIDVGIATLPPMSFARIINESAVNLAEDNVRKVLARGKFVVTLGGEHTISTGPIAAHFAKYPAMSVLQFDAHSDLRDEYNSTKYSHASVMARVADFFPANRIVQVGIRAQCKEEATFIRENKIKTFYASAIRRGLHGEDWQKEVVKALGNDVYITFDVDYFDPSVIPATGTPEPDGFFWNETMDIFRAIVASGKRIVGFDIVEVAPNDATRHSTYTAARLAYKIMNYAFVGRKKDSLAKAPEVKHAAAKSAPAKKKKK